MVWISRQQAAELAQRREEHGFGEDAHEAGGAGEFDVADAAGDLCRTAALGARDQRKPCAGARRVANLDDALERDIRRASQ